MWQIKERQEKEGGKKVWAEVHFMSLEHFRELSKKHLYIMRDCCFTSCTRRGGVYHLWGRGANGAEAWGRGARLDKREEHGFTQMLHLFMHVIKLIKFDENFHLHEWRIFLLVHQPICQNHQRPTLIGRWVWWGEAKWAQGTKRDERERENKKTR